MPDVSYLLYELLVDPEQLLRVLQLDRDTVLVISRPRGNVVTRAPGPGRLLSRVTCHVPSCDTCGGWTHLHEAGGHDPGLADEPHPLPLLLVGGVGVEVGLSLQTVHGGGRTWSQQRYITDPLILIQQTFLNFDIDTAYYEFTIFGEGTDSRRQLLAPSPSC